MKKMMSIRGWMTWPLLAAAVLAFLIWQLVLPGPGPAYANRYHLECPDRILEGESQPAQVRHHASVPSGFDVRWETFHDEEGLTAEAGDYKPLNKTSGSSVHESTVGRMREGLYTIEDDLIEEDETFGLRIDKSGLQCTIIIVDNDPGVTDVQVVSTPADGEAYRAGEEIEIDVTFNHPVRVTGRPALTLDIRDGGAPPQDFTVRSAPYVSGSGADTLRFSYTVQVGDNDNNGFIVSQRDRYGPIEGTIKADVPGHRNRNAYYAFDRDTSPHVQQSIPGQLIATGRPVVTGVAIASSPADGETYGPGERVEIDVTFNGKVKAVDAPVLGLRVDGSDRRDSAYVREAVYASGSGADTLRFAYEVQLGDEDGNGLAIMNDGFADFGPGKIQAHHLPWDIDPASLANAPLVGHSLPGHKVNAGVPTVTDVEVVSTPAQSKGYQAGENILVVVTFSKPVRVVGEPALTLDIRHGGASPQDYTVRSASYLGSDSPDTLTFKYVVQVGDNDNNGFIVSESDDTGLGEGTIKSTDSFLWDWDALHGFDRSTSPHVQQSIPGQRIATGRAVVTDVEIVSSPADGVAYRLGESIEIDVTFNGKVKAVEQPTLGLLVRGADAPDIGRRAYWREAAYASGSGTETIRFSYAVQFDDEDDDGIVIRTNGLRSESGKLQSAHLPWDVDRDSLNDHPMVGPSLPGPPWEGHAVAEADVAPPTVTDVRVVSTPFQSKGYQVGENILVVVTFSKPVRVVGEPVLTLDIRNGGAPPQDFTVRSASYLGSNAAETLTFKYVVQAGDNDNNGFIVSESNDTGLGEGTIKSTDSFLWDWDALHGFDRSTSPHVQQSIPGQRIATGRAVVTDVEVASSPADGVAYRLGESIEIDVTFNGKVKAVEQPTLGLLVRGADAPDIGRRAYWREAAYASGSGTETIRFSYAVQLGDQDDDGIVIRTNGLRSESGKLQSAHLPWDVDRDSLNDHPMVGPSLPGPPWEDHRVKSSGGL